MSNEQINESNNRLIKSLQDQIRSLELSLEVQKKLVEVYALKVEELKTFLKQIKTNKYANNRNP